MGLELRRHSGSHSAVVKRIEVEAVRTRAGALELQYLIHGDMSGLRLPAPTRPTRVDELWRYTCLEAFVRAEGAEAYYEFNFAPSTQWAAYRFSRYREGMSAAYEVAPPDIEVSAAPDSLELRTAIALPSLAGDWRVALSAVIEAADGAKSYWALAHPEGKPDFHRAESFAMALPAAEAR